MSIPSLDELKARGAAQQPSWPEQPAVDRAVAKLRSMPPLVFAGECDDLKAHLAEVAGGRAFLLQGGDCAETFETLTAENVRAKLQVLLQMAVVLTYAASVPVVKLGRIAGQYAKPRTSDTETRDGVTLPAYRGDAVNGYPFTPESRLHDPDRLVQVYHPSAATLNLSRAFLQGGYADLRQMHAWNTDFVRTSPVGAQYEKMAAEIDRALDFMKAIGAESEQLHRVDFHSSHEALILEYEHATDPDRLADPAALRRQRPLPLDRRTHPTARRGTRGAAVEGAQPDRREARTRPRRPTKPSSYAEKLNPDNEAGRLTFITRMGAGRIRDVLPNLVEKVTAAGIEVAWVSDPDARQHVSRPRRVTRPATSTT